MSGRRPTSARPTPARRSTSSERRGSVSETPSRKKMEEMEHDCKMAFLVVAEDLNDNLTSKEQLRNVLNQTGRNPSNRALDKHWRSSTDSVSFEDVLQIARQIPLTSEDDLMKAFRKIDINGDGYISNDELFKVMTTRGDKMTRREVQAIIDEVDENKDGRLDYKEFCQMMLATQEECGKIAKQRYEKRRLKQEAQSKSKTKSPNDVKASPRPKDRTKSPVALKKLKLPEPKRLKDWDMTHSKGCFFFEDDGAIVSHQYMLQLSKDSSVWLTIEPFSLKTGSDLNSAREVGTPPIDTAAFILRDKPDEDGNTLVTFTEQRDSKGRYCVRCDLEKGRYLILPFTTGCRFHQRKSEPRTESKLVKAEKDDKYVLTKAFKETLSDIFEICDLDGNGLMNRDEFNWFNIRTSGEEVQDDEWDVVEDNVELKNGEITRNGFITLNQMEAEDNQGDTDDLWVTLNNMGYNKGLIQDEAVPFLVEVFAEDCSPTLKVTGINPAQNKLERAMSQIATSKGEMTRVKNMKDLFLYTWMNDFRACVVVDNKSRSRVTLSLDCSKSRNCSTNRNDLDFTLEVSPKATVVGHHILPSNERQEWCLRCVDTIVK